MTTTIILLLLLLFPQLSLLQLHRFIGLLPLRLLVLQELLLLLQLEQHVLSATTTCTKDLYCTDTDGDQGGVWTRLQFPLPDTSSNLKCAEM